MGKRSVHGDRSALHNNHHDFMRYLVPLMAHFLGGWYAYWSHAVLAIIFALAVVLLKTRWYWEEN